jgi:hypothetical protein
VIILAVLAHDHTVTPLSEKSGIPAFATGRTTRPLKQALSSRHADKASHIA